MNTTTPPPTSAVLLSAGAGTRLGRGPKALLPFRGRTLVEVLAGELLAGGCAEVTVVLGAGADDARALPGLSGCTVVENPQWQDGMAGSFRAGLGAALAGHHVMVALVDQPGMSADVVDRLIREHRAGRVTAAAYSGPSGPRRGHPLIIDAALRRAAADSATGDAGARGFLRDHPELIDLVDCSDLGDGGDVDTAADLRLLE
ncbi:nicotine blue oxidoreductase [Zhihengliuella salsuginis]|uniref:4-diphosphocytidyl-2C-methyl-D-erythritol synthase n=1 Tax=Zhihengliuella salsuginis TaxID=578222 RepID=A0ABQ3GKH8_9MICC|nr:nucleotidyltransferase family protein [Zhihengliuella salsuginis]GHD12399.1 4-diphosphocytidyl-2C-methyl-D-erythritol synthase [Zhihengliuella salsuginis]